MAQVPGLPVPNWSLSGGSQLPQDSQHLDFGVGSAGGCEAQVLSVLDVRVFTGILGPGIWPSGYLLTTCVLAVLIACPFISKCPNMA